MTIGQPTKLSGLDQTNRKLLLKYIFSAAFGLALIILAGWFYTYSVRNSKIEELQKEYVNTARTAAISIIPQNVRLLNDPQAGVSSQAYTVIKQHLVDLENVDANSNYYYLLGETRAGIVYLADSAAPGSAFFAQPGSSYTESIRMVSQVLTNGNPVFIGFHSDKRGEWQSVLVPVQDSGGGSVVAVLGFDLPASAWNTEMANAQREPILLSLLASFLYISVIVFHFRAEKSRDELRAEVHTRTAGESAYRAQFAENTAVMLLIDPQNARVLDANLAAEKFYMYTRDQLLTLTMADLNVMPPDQVMLTMAAIENNSGGHYLFQHRLADGSIRDIDVNASMISMGGRNTLHAIIYDITERKKAENQIRILSKVVESSPESIVITDTHGRIEYANPRFSEITGYSLAEVINHVPRMMVEKNMTSNQAGLWNSIHAGKAWNGVMPAKKKNGETYWESATVSALLDDDGQISHYFSISDDITQRKMVEDSLHLSLERLKLAAQAGRLGIWDLDVTNNELVWDEQMYALYGLNPAQSDLDTHSWRQCLHPEDAARADADFAAAIAGARDYDTDFRIIHAGDHTIRYIRTIAVVLRNDAGKPTRMIGVNWDVTRDREREIDLLLSNELLQQVPGIVFYKDTSSVYLHANQTFCKLMKVPGDQIIGLSDMDLLPEPEARRFHDEDRRILAGLDDSQYNEQEIQDGANRLFIATRKVPVRNNQGQIIGLLGLGIDITRRKQVEQSLRETNDKLAAAITQANEQTVKARKADKAKSEFLANMSHEIRTPLNGVIGMTGLLLDTDLLPEQRQYAAIIRSSGETLITLVNDILDFSKIEANKLDLEMLDFNLQDMLDDTIEPLTIRAQEKNLTIRCRMEPNVPNLVRGDPGRLGQVLTNLASNAVKFTSLGSVSITVLLDQETSAEYILRFVVKDTGIGIAADRLSELFTPFTQVDSSTTRKYGGSGLGLAISRQLVGLMKGQIGVDSTPGSGSTFWFSAVLEKPLTRPTATLNQPLAEKSAPAEVFSHATGNSVPHTAPAKSLMKHTHILLVEDNPTNQLVALSILRKLGYHADAVANGLEAVRTLAEIPYDLVLMDCQMPEMDGFTATAAIRAPHSTALNPAVPIIAMTAHAMKGDRETCLAAGMDDYLTKPIKTAELAKMIKDWLPKTIEPEAAHSSVQPSAAPAPAVAVEPQQEKPAIFDEVDLLNRLMDDTDLEKVIMEAFITEVPQQIEKLKSEALVSNAAGVRLMAHTIRGSSANLGALALRQAAHQIEIHAEKGELDKVKELLPEVENQLEIFLGTIARMEKFVNS